MAKKILKTLVNNLGFKILAVVLAFILWLVVYNIDGSEKIKNIYNKCNGGKCVRSYRYEQVL